MNSGSVSEIDSIAWGSGIALVNICIAIIAFRIALRQADVTVFLRIIFGSMAGRAVLTLAFVWYGLKILHFATIPFVAALLFCYVSGLGAEILILHRKQLEISRRYYQKIGETKPNASEEAIHRNNR